MSLIVFKSNQVMNRYIKDSFAWVLSKTIFTAQEISECFCQNSLIFLVIVFQDYISKFEYRYNFTSLFSSCLIKVARLLELLPSTAKIYATIGDACAEFQSNHAISVSWKPNLTLLDSYS